MSFRQFAFNNVRRNGRAYLAFFLSSSFMVMIFFCYAMLIFHPGLLEHRIGEMTRTGMIVAEYIIYIFSFLFVLYSISTFLKVRQKEFGVLVLLGATTGQLNRLVFMENMIIGFASVIAGVASGLLLSKAFLLISSNIVILELPFYWPLQAILLTCTAFLILFFLLSLFTLVFIRKNRILELLKGSSKPKEEPKTSWWLALLAVLLLTLSVINLNSEHLSSKNLFAAVITGISGTYFFYTQLTVPLIRALKKNRHLYWKGTNLLWLSEMAYKLKDNARMLFMVNVFIALACMSAGLIISIDMDYKKKYEAMPYAFVYKVNNEETITEETEGIEAILEQNNVEFTRIDWPSFYTDARSDEGTQGYYTEYYTEFVPLSQAKRSEAEYLKNIPEHLSGDEAYLLVSSSYADSHASVKEVIYADFQYGADPEQIQVVGSELVAYLEGGASWQLIVSDEAYSRYVEEYGEQDQIWSRMQVFYHIPAWEGKRPPGLQDEAVAVSNQVLAWMEGEGGHASANFVRSKVSDYYELKQSTSVLGFIGVFVAAIFSIASASFLYFKLFSELNQDRHIYRSLSKIGLSRNEMRQSATIQMAVLFFIPIVISTIQALVVLTPLGENFSLEVTTLPVLMASSAFFAAQLLFFLVIRARYVMQLRRIMV
ncbi:FtsX-like permease family protein [Paenibacillus senegalensis]|uniref:FtsX-like permease family protein n=1 Tax=Paenibacillus senegalensis TaxID=1465766 RepID=UPI000288EC8B|nr:FtsX-like permease family protein [Paenibacillus senegalensis]